MLKRLIFSVILFFAVLTSLAQENSTAHEINVSIENIGFIADIVWSPDGAWIAVATDTGVWLYDVGNQTMLTDPLIEDTFVQVQVDHDSEQVIGRTDTHQFVTIDLESSTANHYDRSDVVGEISDMTVTPDDQLLAATIDGTTARIWDAITGEELFSVEREYMSAIAFQADGQSIVLADPPDRPMGGGGGRLIYVYDIKTQQQMYDLSCTCSEIIGVAISNDERYIAGIREDRIYMWNVVSEEWLMTVDLEDSFKDFVEIIFSPDGEWLIAGLDDGQGGAVRIWHVESEIEYDVDHDWQNTDVTNIAFSPDFENWASASRTDLWIRSFPTIDGE